MRKLLRASFFRLRTSKALWLCAAAAFVFSAFRIFKIPSDNLQKYSLEEAMMDVFPFFPILYGVFSGLFLGVEYQDGTLRNKLIAGHSRQNVYLSSLVTIISVCCMPESAFPTARNAAGRSAGRVWIRWRIRSCSCRSGRRSSCWRRWCGDARAST